MVLAKLAKMYFAPSSAAIRYAPYLLILPIIVFEALSLTGCVSTSPAIPNIYLVSLKSNTGNATETPVQVRIGYYGICGIDEDGTRCQSASGRSVEELTPNLFPETVNKNSSSNATSSDVDVADLINTALNLQSQSFMSVLAMSGLLFLIGVGSLLVYKFDVKKGSFDHPRRSAIIRRVTYGSLFLSTGLVFAAALATDQSADALEFASAGMKNASVLIKSGTTLQVLQWMAFGFSLLFTLLVPILVREKAPAMTFKEGA
ncbi:hypothetical protein N656DRAFT_766822 [Canariomyces notabilis]|uniref:Ca2+ regulator and membrane fusion protein Fig1-domain-containing protein n=1 Tax=Canariomyces notabilis TaxID=2074819 RepID=A0AAN6YV38_9PEZI|nr:hypothetical protein N656DRAFT_766822 [Canariomyces arenarius]